MGKKSTEEFWTGVSVPTFDDFLDDLDYRLMAEIVDDRTGALPAMYRFFDDNPEKPLSPRELLQFWAALSEEERLFFMLEFC